MQAKAPVADLIGGQPPKSESTIGQQGVAEATREVRNPLGQDQADLLSLASAAQPPRPQRHHRVVFHGESEMSEDLGLEELSIQRVPVEEVVHANPISAQAPVLVAEGSLV